MTRLFEFRTGLLFRSSFIASLTSVQCTDVSFPHKSEGSTLVILHVCVWCASTASKSESPTPTNRCRGLRLVDVGDIDFSGKKQGDKEDLNNDGNTSVVS